MPRKQPAEQVAGRYSAVPHSVLDSAAFSGASHPARSLLMELMRQHTGRNNGHLQLASGWLKRRGWKSADVVQRAKVELRVRQLVIKTRLGGLNAGPDLWALTWLPISDYSGLSEVSARTYHPGAWHFLDKAVPLPKRDERTGRRNSTVPGDGIADPFTVPGDGTKTVLSDPLAVPSNGNNEVTSSRGRSVARRVVGRKRASGKPTTTATVYRLHQPSSTINYTKRKQA